MICVRPSLMYWPRREMKARNNMRKRVQRTQSQILRRIQKNQTSKAQQMYKNDRHNTFNKNFFKDGQIKKKKNSRNKKIVKNTKLWLCAAVRPKQCLFNLKKNCYLRFKPLQ